MYYSINTMEYISDLHLHSKYARSCSPELTLENIARVAEEKGIGLVGTGDFCHPAWAKEIENKLEEVGKGIYKLKGSGKTPLFVLSNEISCIYSQGGKTRRLHICIWAPDIGFVKKLNNALAKRGCKLASDGRPIIGMSAKELLKICLEIDEKHLTIPAHAWTPWFAIFGSKSGFDSIDECYEELTPYIYAIETGLSSDPLMNWSVSALDKVMLVSNSDAHSLDNLGREANIWDLENPSFSEIYDLLKNKDKKKFISTIEFFPEEGMYHIDGHRDCDFSCLPIQTKKINGICPKCKQALTIGVLNRVDKLADRKEKDINSSDFVPFQSLVPLKEIISDCLGVGKHSKSVLEIYKQLIQKGRNEFNILRNLNHDELKSFCHPAIMEGIIRVRNRQIELIPGFDGRYGKIKLFKDSEKIKPKQIALF